MSSLPRYRFTTRLLEKNLGFTWPVGCTIPTMFGQSYLNLELKVETKGEQWRYYQSSVWD
jgi:hypothetical protein